jgi:hypothetical protein
MTEKRSERDKEFDEHWEGAQRVKVRRSEDTKKTSVFSIKMDRDLLRILVERARELGVGPSTLARSLIEEGLLSEGQGLPDEAFLEALRIRLRKSEGSSGRVIATKTVSFKHTDEKVNAARRQSSET